MGNDVKTHTPYIGELPSRIGLGATVGFAHREYVNAHLPGGLTRREPPGRPCGRNPPYSRQIYILSLLFQGGGKKLERKCHYWGRSLVLAINRGCFRAQSLRRCTD